MSFECIFSAYIKPAIPIIAVILAYWLGKSAYFRQKEYEIITDRYLRDGLDRITAQVERSLAIFRHNWAHSLNILKSYRDTGKDIDKGLIKSGFIEPETGMFEFWPDHRLFELVRDDIIHKARQSLDAFVRNSYAFFVNDLCTAVRLSVEGGEQLEVTAKPSEIINSYFKELEDLDKESILYYSLINELQKISSVLQTERFSFKTIKEFSKKEIIKGSISELRKIFNN